MKKETTTPPAEEWCAECVGKFPSYASSYDFNSQYCGTSKSVDSWMEEQRMAGAGSIPNNQSYITCVKHR